MNRCQIIILSLDDLPENFSGDCRDLRTTDGAICYEYNAPEGFETLVGRGILFENDWTQDDTLSLVQVWKNGTWT